ncbi:MAG: hypothetical protein KDI36_18635 [Pseudomonadales bacterium]|nr:hypothetical protein [Pseudomonadales bacterium]
MVNYGEAILEGFEYLLGNHPEVFVMGQGLWSPWYVGNSMTDLDKKFGKERVIDTPVSELACTGAAVGASMCGYKPIVVHPRIDFMMYAIDPIVNQAAKWSHMLGGQANAAVTIRGIVNRGGEQGAQHSQALHSWFAHVPGLRVVMPASVQDARDLLISSALSNDPVVFIDDRWLYDREAELPPIEPIPLEQIGPAIVKKGADITLVGSSFSTYLCEQAAGMLSINKIDAEVIDLRVINPLDVSLIVESVRKTGHLCVVDGGWTNCGLAGEVIAAVTERCEPVCFKSAPRRLTLTDTPAPTSKHLEAAYYTSVEDIINTVNGILDKS